MASRARKFPGLSRNRHLKNQVRKTRVINAKEIKPDFTAICFAAWILAKYHQSRSNQRNLYAGW